MLQIEPTDQRDPMTTRNGRNCLGKIRRHYVRRHADGDMVTGYPWGVSCRIIQDDCDFI